MTACSVQRQRRLRECSKDSAYIEAEISSHAAESTFLPIQGKYSKQLAYFDVGFCGTPIIPKLFADKILLSRSHLEESILSRHEEIYMTLVFPSRKDLWTFMSHD